MGIKYSFEIDVWSTGCILAELFTGIPLFPGENEKEQMKYFMKTLGVPEPLFATKGERSPFFFDSDGIPH
jgi:serine/threonine protein kinase